MDQPRQTADAHAAAEVLRRFFQVQTEADHDSVAAFLSEEHTGFGTGPDELVLSKQTALDLITRQREQASDVQVVDFSILRTHMVMPDVCVLLGTARYTASVSGEDLELHVRMSFVLERTSGDWKLAHQHISEPALEQGVGESYPLQRIKARNLELEALVAERTQDLEHAMTALRREATTDRLTSLPNRAKLDEILTREHARVQRGGEQVLLGIIDIDNFKNVNDDFGHITGDSVLRSVASVLASSLRGSDVVGRWGGEEFLLILHEGSGSSADKALDRIRTELKQHDFGIGRGVTVSGGLTRYQDPESLDSWLSRADSLLYEAKTGGRDRILQDG